MTYTESYLKSRCDAPNAFLHIAVIIPAHPRPTLEAGKKLRWEPLIDYVLNQVFARLHLMYNIAPGGCNAAAFFYGADAERPPWKAIESGIDVSLRTILQLSPIK